MTFYLLGRLHYLGAWPTLNFLRGNKPNNSISVVDLPLDGVTCHVVLERSVINDSTPRYNNRYSRLGQLTYVTYPILYSMVRPYGLLDFVLVQKSLSCQKRKLLMYGTLKECLPNLPLETRKTIKNLKFFITTILCFPKKFLNDISNIEKKHLWIHRFEENTRITTRESLISRFTKQGKLDYQSSFSPLLSQICQFCRPPDFQGLGVTDRVNWRTWTNCWIFWRDSCRERAPEDVKPTKCATVPVKMLLLIKSETQWWKCTKRVQHDLMCGEDTKLKMSLFSSILEPSSHLHVTHLRHIQPSNPPLPPTWLPTYLSGDRTYVCWPLMCDRSSVSPKTKISTPWCLSHITLTVTGSLSPGIFCMTHTLFSWHTLREINVNTTWREKGQN